MRKGIPTSEHATLVFELTSFTADVLGKLVKPGTNRKKKNSLQEQGSCCMKSTSYADLGVSNWINTATCNSALHLLT